MNIENFITKIELDYLSGTGTNEQNIKKLPITDKKTNKGSYLEFTH